MTERRADEAGRDVGQWLKCQFMREKLGEEYQGTITGVAGFGLFILLDELFVEGMVHVTQLPPDYWVFSEQQHTLIGERTHQAFRLADKVQVKVVRVDLDARRIDFALVGTAPVGRIQKASIRSDLKVGKTRRKSERKDRMSKVRKKRR